LGEKNKMKIKLSDVQKETIKNNALGLAIVLVIVLFIVWVWV
jgi:hypothetical protein